MYQIVPMTEDHLEQVEEIERLCFGDPWSRKIFEQSLAEEKTTAEQVRMCFEAYRAETWETLLD